MKTTRRVVYLTRTQARSWSYLPVDVISLYQRDRTPLDPEPALRLSRRQRGQGKTETSTSLALRPEATTGCEGSGGCGVA